MNKIFVLRHAMSSDEGDNPPLSLFGQKQAIELSRKIQEDLKDFTGVVHVWVSKALRAQETGMPIASKFESIEFEVYDELWADSTHSYDPMKFRQKLQSFKGEVLICITHLPYVQYTYRLHGTEGKRPAYAQGVLVEDNVCKDFG